MDTFDRVMFGALGVLLIATFVLLVGVSVSSIQEVRAAQSQIDCRVKQLDAVRAPFASRYTCVPFEMRQDTLTIKK